MSSCRKLNATSCTFIFSVFHKLDSSFKLLWIREGTNSSSFLQELHRHSELCRRIKSALFIDVGALNQPVVQLVEWTSSAMISPDGRVLKLHAWVHKLASNAAWISDYTVRTCMQDGKPLTAASSDMNSVCCLPTCCLPPYCQVLLSSCVKLPLGSTPLSTEICLCYCGDFALASQLVVHAANAVHA